MNKLNTLTIAKARKGLRNKEFKIIDLVKACLNQIKKEDPQIKAFITVCNKKSIKLAKKYDKEIKNNPNIFKEKPLLGIPIALKDNFCTKNIKTTAGSKVLEDFIPKYDATVIKKLKKAGAIIIGKTNMDAWAHGSSTETSQFFTTHNPHDLNHSPGGSSGGSAAAVASNMTIAAIGSETAGSIRQPAAWCGVTGLKPTYGRVSRWGVIAMASSTDSPGPLTKTVQDSATLLSVLAGKDKKDATSSPKSTEKYHKNLNKINPKKITLGIPKEYFLKNMDKTTKQKVETGISQFEKLGFQTREVSLLDPKYSIAVYTIIQRAEVSSNLARYDGIRYGNDRTNLGKEAQKRIMLGTYALSAGYYDEYYKKAQKVRTKIINNFSRVFKKVDALVAPTSPTPALKIGESKNQPMFGEMQDVLVEASSLAGLPGININCGFKNKLPIGMQIITPQFEEKLLLQIAQQYEQKTIV